MGLQTARLLFVSLLLALLTGCMAGPEAKKDPVFYPAAPDRPRLQFLTSITSIDDLTGKRKGFDDFLLGGRETDSSMGRPYAVHAVRGAIYLTDRVSNDILQIDLAKNSINPLRAGGRGALMMPSGIWVGEDGTKYIADLKRQQVVMFDQNNNFAGTLGGPDQLERPSDVAVYGDRVYVSDMKKHQVAVFDRVSGKQVAVIGGAGEKEGLFNRPSHLTVDRQGTLIVNDAFNFRIQKFSPEGTFLQQVGSPGNALGNLARPKGIAVDNDGNLYVVDAAFENVQIFNKEGRLLMFFGGFGERPGSLYLPAGIAIDYQNVGYFQKYADPRFKITYLVYVCNMTGANKLNVYGFGEWTGDLPGK